jgi:hypothetical protein
MGNTLNQTSPSQQSLQSQKNEAAKKACHQLLEDIKACNDGLIASGVSQRMTESETVVQLNEWAARVNVLIATLKTKRRALPGTIRLSDHNQAITDKNTNTNTRVDQAGPYFDFELVLVRSNNGQGDAANRGKWGETFQLALEWTNGFVDAMNYEQLSTEATRRLQSAPKQEISVKKRRGSGSMKGGVQDVDAMNQLLGDVLAENISAINESRLTFPNEFSRRKVARDRVYPLAHGYVQSVSDVIITLYWVILLVQMSRFLCSSYTSFSVKILLKIISSSV